MRQDVERQVAIISRGDETRFGAELMFIQPFSCECDLAIRAGVLSYNMTDEQLLSAGLGWTSGSWTLDLSASEDEYAPELTVYNATISYSF